MRGVVVSARSGCSRVVVRYICSYTSTSVTECRSCSTQILSTTFRSRLLHATRRNVNFIELISCLEFICKQTNKNVKLLVALCKSSQFSSPHQFLHANAIFISLYIVKYRRSLRSNSWISDQLLNTSNASQRKVFFTRKVRNCTLVCTLLSFIYEKKRKKKNIQMNRRQFKLEKSIDREYRSFKTKRKQFVVWNWNS